MKKQEVDSITLSCNSSFKICVNNIKGRQYIFGVRNKIKVMII